jgi:Fe2+ or Zn2+ uptake regulation protein
MNLEYSLEETILKIVWETIRPLNTLEIWELLEARKTKIPLNYLYKVLQAMVRVKLLQEFINPGKEALYQPALSIFQFYRSPLTILQL